SCHTPLVAKAHFLSPAAQSKLGAATLGFRSRKIHERSFTLSAAPRYGKITEVTEGSYARCKFKEECLNYTRRMTPVTCHCHRPSLLCGYYGPSRPCGVLGQGLRQPTHAGPVRTGNGGRAYALDLSRIGAARRPALRCHRPRLSRRSEFRGIPGALASIAQKSLQHADRDCR